MQRDPETGLWLPEKTVYRPTECGIFGGPIPAPGDLGPGPGPGPAAGFSLTTDGKLAKHIAGDAQDPFQTADWTLFSQQGGSSLALGPGGELEATLATEGGHWAVLQYDPIASRSEAMVQCRVRKDGSSAFVGAAGHRHNSGSGSGDEEHNYVRGVIDVGNTDRLNLAQVDDGVSNNFVADATGIAAKALGTYYRLTFWFQADTQMIVYSHPDDVEQSTTSHTFTSGRIGLISLENGNEARWDEALLHAEKVLTVTGLSTGEKAKVLDAADAVLASATESGGVADVDVSHAWMNDAEHLIVTDNADVEQNRHTPARGLWGGDEWAYTP